MLLLTKWQSAFLGIFTKILKADKNRL